MSRMVKTIKVIPKGLGAYLIFEVPTKALSQDVIDEINMLLEEEENIEIELEYSEMTQEEYNSLPEFMGY